jgi:hypothetical protein
MLRFDPDDAEPLAYVQDKIFEAGKTFFRTAGILLGSDLLNV